MQLLASKVSADYYYTRPPGIVGLLILTIIYIQDRFNNHVENSLYRILVMEPSFMGVMKMRNIVHRVGIEPTSLAFRASLLTAVPRRRSGCHYYTHAYLSMQFLA